MVIRKIMEQHKEELKVFASSMKKQGFIDELKSFFAEVYQYDVSMEDLKKTMDPSKYVGRAPQQVDEFLSEVVNPILEANKEVLGMTAEITV